MPTTAPHAHRIAAATAEETAVVPPRAVIAVVAVLAAAWIAAGSTGVLGDPLRRALCAFALAVAAISGWPRRKTAIGDGLLAAAFAAAALAMIASRLPTINVLAVSMAAAGLARLQTGTSAHAVRIAAVATAVLGLFRWACAAIPVVCLTADGLGGMLGSLVGWIAGKALSVGATFGGVDFLVLTGALAVGWSMHTPRPRRYRVGYVCAGVALGHLFYLAVLAHCDDLLTALPDVVQPAAAEDHRLGAWAWADAVRALLPWNLPVLAAAIHLTIAAAMFRWSPLVSSATPEGGGAEDDGRNTLCARTTRYARRFGPLVLALLLPWLTGLGLSRSTLDGKSVVAYQQGYVRWTVPQYDHQPPADKPRATECGLLPVLVESLGGECVLSPDLGADDLARADVVLLLHPDRPWTADQSEDIRKFVEDGGAVLLAAGPPVVDYGGEDAYASSANELLESLGAAMRFRHDVATPVIARWQHGLQTAAHPVACAGVGRRNGPGLTSSASIDVGWPARPLLTGRYGFSGPAIATAGIPTAATPASIWQPDAGQRLGDLVLAAEQRIGRGRIVVLADTAILGNDATAASYVFTGRLLSYLAGGSAGPQAGGRQWLGLVVVLTLVGVLLWRPDWRQTALIAMALAASATGCTAVMRHTSRVVPDGRRNDAPNALAYIDASHLEAYSSETWADDGIGGLQRQLMREGYLPLLLLPEVTGERLEGAGLLISIGPARAFTAAEIQTVRKFVESGGTLICMAGAEQAAALKPLLAEFGFRVSVTPLPATSTDREPVPLGMGVLKSDQVSVAGGLVSLRTTASWEVRGRTDAVAIARWHDGSKDREFIVARSGGKGTVAVIGDTLLAVNRNLEPAPGELTENVRFWRWFLPQVTDRPVWPPAEEVAP